jgi:CHAT domain-containing protein
MYFRNDAAHAGALADLPPLPNAASEIARVARGFGPKYAEVLLGDEASEATLKSMDLTRFSTILFATHGLVSGEMDGVSEPALVLARPSRETAGDGLLTASEIASLKLDADWIILSACNTAAGSEAEAPAYSGLAQAFRYAGARTLLLSHWPVRDDAAAFISVKAIASARKGLRRDVALQRATIALLDSRTIANASDPYIWAPYMLLGDVRDR